MLTSEYEKTETLMPPTNDFTDLRPFIRWLFYTENTVFNLKSV